jgi:uncharacterized protein
MHKVLITGGTGLIGTRLTEMLLAKGYRVHHLGREKREWPDERIKSFVWSIEKGKVDKAAFDGVETVIHLAGAGVADKRWTPARKKEIMDSRVLSGNILYKFLKTNEHHVKTFISAGAVGYYGDCADEIIIEEHKPGRDFLATVCKKWEMAAIKIGELGIRELRCRIGIVLARNGGALPELTKTLSLGFATYFSKQPLYYPWVHLDDVCGVMIYGLENTKLHGPYNTTAPTALPMKTLMQEIVAIKKTGAVLIPAPAFAIKIGLGEMSEAVLNSQRCSAGKLLSAGYKFVFADEKQALKNVLS